MSDALSSDELSALLGETETTGNVDDDAVIESSKTYAAEIMSEEQKDILGEVGNISMGTSATTMSTLLNQPVNITTPTVSTMTWKEISSKYDRPCVGVKIDYTIGLQGTNVLILKNRDVKIITDLMMGGTGEFAEDVEEELSEIDLSAIGEAMNQMMGSSSTSLSKFVSERIDITTPKAFHIDFSDDEFAANFGFNDDPVAVITFKLTIGDLLDSNLMQVYPINFATQMAEKLKANFGSVENVEQKPQARNTNVEANNKNINVQQSIQGGRFMDQQSQHSTFAPGNVNASPAQFQSFDVTSVAQQKENIDILMDVPLEVTVELGRTSKRIKEILEFSPGTIIELDKLAGEPIDILVNGKYVAKGEVVVIDENFGIRVTSIISPEYRI